MFLNKADKKELFEITFTSLLVMVKIQQKKRPSTFAISSAVRKCQKLNECDVFMLTLLTDKKWFICERMLYDVIK